jgi:hypothetical protein
MEKYIKEMREYNHEKGKINMKHDMFNCSEQKKLPYSGPAYDACKAWFDKHCAEKGYHNTGEDCMDMWFDDLYMAWTAALDWDHKSGGPIGGYPGGSFSD